MRHLNQDLHYHFQQLKYKTMKFKTTKQLMKEVEDKPVFWLVWSIIWRLYLVVFVLGFVYGILLTV